MNNLLNFLIVSLCNYAPFFIQDKKTCTDVDYYHQVYDDDDYFGDILNIFDYPVETLEGDTLNEDWAAKLGPIPSEVFKEMPPPVTNVNNGGGGGDCSVDSFPESCVLVSPIFFRILYFFNFVNGKIRFQTSAIYLHVY